jgi:antitoxin component of MazEF toxin-antitoxin module
MKRYVRLRKAGGSLIMVIPGEFVRAYQLKHGDSFLWLSEEVSITLKFDRATLSSPLVKETVEAAVTDLKAKIKALEAVIGAT